LSPKRRPHRPPLRNNAKPRNKTGPTRSRARNYTRSSRQITRDRRRRIKPAADAA